MRNPNRIEPMLARVQEIWNHNPDLRLIQLIMNVFEMADDLYYVEDETLKEALDKYYIETAEEDEQIDNKSSI